MKIAFFQFYPPTIWTPGGGEIQLAKTKEALERQGVEVILFDPWSRSRNFDILHVFGSTYEVSSFIKVAKELGIPVVVSTISYSAKPRWQWGLWRRLDRLVPIPTIYRLRQQIYDSADRLIVMSRAEAEQLKHSFSIKNEKLRWVPQGIDSRRFQKATPELFIQHFNIKDFVLQVARINRHKGQIRLIQALCDIGIPMVFIGPLDPSDSVCVKEFLEISKKYPQIHYLGSFDHNDPLLISAYAAAKVFVLPSISESFGLSILEAAAAGTRVVTGKYPPLYEYLGDRIVYCDPLSIKSIREAVLKAYHSRPSEELKKYVLDNFSWDRVAERLIKIYKELI